MKAPLQRCLVAMPVDGRPAVRSQVQALAAAAGWQLLMPEVAALGHLRQPADRAALGRWLLDHAAQADGFVLSVDMLAYGGLVPSRFIRDTLAELQARLAVIDELRQRWPDKPVYAFAATLRISNNDVADEEKPYWAAHGRQLWRWSFHSDRAASSQAEDSVAEAAAAAALIPAAVRADYRSTRERNFALTRGLLQAVQDGRITRLVLPQDDTAEWGFNVAERRALQAEVAARGLQGRVAIYAGADEVMHTLCAHLVRRLVGCAPLRVALSCSDPEHIARLVPLYEDRPVMQGVASQMQAVGAVLIDSATVDGDPFGTRQKAPRPGVDADWLLALHTQGTAQGDWAMRRPLPQRVAVASTWFEGIAAWQAAGRPVALADLAFANGGDPWLLAQPALKLSALAAYAGWNTAGNSLGSVLAHAALMDAAEIDRADDATAPASPTWNAAAARQATALRLLEDGLYQAQLRQALRDSIDECSVDAATLQHRAQAQVLPTANAWAAAHGLGVLVTGLRLPWDRTFEVDLRVESAAPEDQTGRDAQMPAARDRLRTD